MKTNGRLWIGVVASLLLLLGVLAGTKAAQIDAMKKAGAAGGPPPVSVA